MTPRPVLFVGGGTGGHVFPAIAVAKALSRLRDDLEPVFVGVEDRLEARLVPEAGFRFTATEAAPLPRSLSPGLLRLPAAVLRARRAAAEVLDRVDPAAVASFGGYVSFPVAWASHARGTPLVVHEQNAIPGLTNRIVGRWAERLAVTFPSSQARFRGARRTVVTGNPVREDFLAPPPPVEEARRRFALDPDRPVLLVFGGSQGARSINLATVRAVTRWHDVGGLQILHAAGRARYDETLAAWRETGITPAVSDGDGGAAPHRPHGPVRVRLLDFIDDMPAAYRASDVVVCRAGATSIAELTVLGVPSVLVPYPHATADHQTANAAALARVGGAATIADADLTADRLAGAVLPWLTDPAERARVARAARAFGRRDAAENVARLILDVAPAPDGARDQTKETA